MALKIAGEKLIATPGLLAADVQISLHTAAPANDNELDYAGYARQTVAPAGWTVDAVTGNVSNVADIDFPRPAANVADVPTHVGVRGVAGVLLVDGALNPVPAAPAAGARVYVPASGLSISVATDD